MTKAEFFYVTIIDALAEKVWQALTTAAFTKQYWHETEVQSDWQEGSDVVFYVEGGRVGCQGKVLKAEPFNELVYTWHFPENPACAAEKPSRVSFSLEEIDGATKLTVHHDGFPGTGSPTFKMVSEGWPFVLAGLKSLLEKGATRDFSMLPMGEDA